MNKTIFFFLTPIITIALFFLTTYNPFDPSQVITSDVYGVNYHDIGYADGHHIWTGSAQPMQNILPQAYGPTFGYSGAVQSNQIIPSSTAAGSSCDTSAGFNTKSTALFYIQVATSAGGSTCRALALEWDISSISADSTITDVSYRYDITAISNPRNCDFTELTYEPDPTGSATVWDDIIGLISDVNYITNNSGCTTVANDKVIDLGSNADTNVQNQVTSGIGWFGLGIHADNMVRSPLSASSTFGAAAAQELQITYNVGAPSGGASDCEAPVSDLHFISLTNTTVNLAWSTPSLGAQTITGYQINYTTPFGTPLTSVTNDTGNTTTAYTVSPLSFNTQYSFRVQPWTNSTCHSPADGNILNVLTNPNLTPGSFPTDWATRANNVTTACHFVRTDINATALLLNVTYPDSYNPAINFHYKYARTNNTYTGFADVPQGNNRTMSSFQFNGVDNEIIDVLFTDQNTNATCKYIITQSQFELLNQIAAFRNGDFGTHGQFGIFDLVTLIVIIISMIGLNRITPIVGAVFCTGIIFAMGYFGIITVPGEITAALAVIVLLAYLTTRKGGS